MTATERPLREPSSPLQIMAAVIAAVAFVFVVLALAGIITDDDPAGPKILSAEDAASSGKPLIELGEMYISGDLDVDTGTTVVVLNAGAAQHNLTVENGPRTPDLNGGEAFELPLQPLSAGEYTVFCAIEGHRAAGMEASLVVG